MNTKQAFNKLIETPSIWKKAGISDSTIRSWRKRMKDNKVSIDAMESALMKAGAKKKPEVWTFKKGM